MRKLITVIALLLSDLMGATTLYPQRFKQLQVRQRQ